MLPPDFEAQMAHWLGTEWPMLRDALEDMPVRGLRLHRWRTPGKDTAPAPDHMDASERPRAPTGADTPLSLQCPSHTVPREVVQAFRGPVPWTDDGFYIPLDSVLGRHVYHETGAYYIQEPSAMAPVAALDPKPGEHILDLCAAPGGKTTAIGRRMQGEGLLVANEIHPTRVLSLAQNLERTGVPAVIANETPQRLADAWPLQFDAILVDAPCSGEGMFRKDPDARQAWSADAPERCAARQREILACAVRMAKPGGRIVYSTCTFNPVENEQLIAWALNHMPVELVHLPVWPGWEPGRPDWADHNPALTRTRRLWPHKAMGEGHFVAGLRVIHNHFKSRQSSNLGRRPEPIFRHWKSWLGSLLNAVPESWLVPEVRSNHVYAARQNGLPLQGLKILRPGLCLATIERDRLEPHHQLAMALSPGMAQNTVELSLPDAVRYLAGETLAQAPAAGWVWFCVNGLPLGWGKSVTGRTNNLYPKGLRRHDLTFVPDPMLQ